jgi:HEAT repeat protein
MSLLGLFGPPNVGKLKAEGNVQGLIKAVGYGKDATIRQAAVQALVEIGHARDAVKALRKIDDAQAVELLIVVLKSKDRDWHMRQAAAEALDERGWQPHNNETGATYWLARGQWDKCVEIGSPAVEPLITAFEDKDWHMRQAAAEALGQIDDARVVDPLIAALYDSSKNVRRAAAGALEKTGAPAVASLVAALKNVEIRTIVTEILETIGVPAVEELTLALEHVDADTRWAATSVLARIGGTQVVEPLIRALEDEDDYVRRGAVEALGQISDPRAVEPLITALEDESKYVRRGAVEALKQIGDARAVKPLISFFREGDQDVRRTAAEALARIDDERTIELLILPLIEELRSDDSKARHDAFVKLSDLAISGDKRLLSPLSEVLHSGYDDARESAATILGDLKDEQALEPLVKATYDPHWPVRYAAIEALGDIGDLRAIEPLWNLHTRESNPRVRGRAVIVCGKLGLGTAIAISHISSLLKDMDVDVAADEISRLVRELLWIGKVVGYLTSPGEGGDAFDGRFRNKEARQIGARLDEMGGFELMQEVYYLVRRELPSEARSLESAWGYIGKWLP